MGTKNCPGDFDCYANAEDDEPMFVLLARDERAPATVRAWAQMRAWFGPIDFDAKNREALACADAMEAWRMARVDGSGT